MEALSDHPLIFFKNLFYGGLLKKLKEKFFNYWENVKENIDDRISINYQEEFVTHLFGIDDNDQECLTREEFTTKLKKLISDESKLSRERINEGIGELVMDLKPVQPFIEKHIRFVKIILTTQTEVLIKYPFCKSELVNLLNYLQEELRKFNDMVDSESEVIVNNKSVSAIKEKRQSCIHSFKWTNVKTDSKIFYDFLVKEKIINKDTENLLKIQIAFSGEKLLKPLEIKWRFKHFNSAKATVTKVIKHWLMDEFKLIEHQENGELAKTLNMIFVDVNGKPFVNLIGALSSVKISLVGMHIKELHKEISAAQPFVKNDTTNP